MNFEEKLRNLFEKNFSKNPMSIKDDRVIGVQEILGQIAGFEKEALSKKEEALEKNITDSTRYYSEIRRRMWAG